MDFKAFINNLQSIKENKLGGIGAQFSLAPKLRLKYSAEKIDASK